MAFTHPSTQKLLTATKDLTPPPAYVHNPNIAASVFDFDESDDVDDFLSAIYLRITTPLTIKGDNNLIAVDASLNSSKIANAVVGSLKQMSMGADGIPMIDENGRPRPIKVEVMAETTIEGSKNVVGEKAVLAATLSSAATRKKVKSGTGGKRQRAASEPIEEARKRLRAE